MTEVRGTTAEGFTGVTEAFQRNFDEFGEVGAACCVYVDGVPVVDVWGGLADQASGRAWESDTLQLHFSTTKGLAAICAAMLYERGLLDYEAPVSQYWPEFAGGGKGGITVAQCMSHRSGLAAVDTPLTLDEIWAVEPVLRAIEAQEPLWEPGSANGYHAITYGWIVGEIVRRIDGRTLGAFLAEEVSGPLGAESYIGLPESEEGRVATLLNSPPPATQEELELMMAVMGPGTMGFRALTMDGAIPFGAPENPFNAREMHATEMPAANGISEARALARIYAATVGDVDGIRLVSDDTVRHVRSERSRGPDLSLVAECAWGLGFMRDLEVNPMLTGESYGHPGAGGSIAFGDLENGVGFAYVMNQMGGGIAGDPRANGLIEALRSCL
ncbi:MAG: serine hydrolase domain-containing protein [Acidimicrobiales bacterium]|jgi:CubicO group peptidase (beta-lactamase class C family)|nr:serine hydrolase domain-containing protein [Acidimicrobiales bacterium]